MNPRQDNCYLIGNDNLVINCATICQDYNINVLGIITSSPKVIEWATSNNINIFSTLKIAQNTLSSTLFDYFFSISNASFVPKSILRMAKKYSINYHNSILPKYAGNNATSWAIYHNEKQHGITWHVMSSEIDQGDVLLQNELDIDINDTAASLNIKCSTLAIQSFNNLLGKLKENTILPTPQTTSNRSYYNRYHKPKYLGVITWNESASYIYRLHRAFDFGHYDNTVTAIKLLLNNSFYIVKKMKITETRSYKPPGSIVAISSQKLQISTIDFDIILEKLLNNSGDPINIIALLKKHNLNLHDQLPIIKQTMLEESLIYAQQHAHHEPYWIRQIRKANNHILDVFQPSKTLFSQHQRICNSITLEKLDALSDLNNTKVTETLVSLILIFFYKINNYRNFTVNIKTRNNLPALFVQYLPLITEFTDELYFHDVVTLIREQIESHEKHGYYASDLIYRYPQQLKTIEKHKVGLIVTTDIETAKQNIEFPITFIIKNSTIHYVLNPRLLDETDLYFLQNIGSALHAFIRDIDRNGNTPIKQLSYLSKEEYQKIIVEWQGVTTPYPQKSIPGLFAEQVQLYPNHIAIQQDDRTMTYVELDKKTNQIAHYLLSIYNTTSQPVAIFLENSVEQIMVIIAILKTGRAFLPIDTRSPIQRIMEIFEDAHPEFIIYENLKANCTLPKNLLDNVWICVQTIIEKSLSFNNKNITISTNQDDLAYIIYTSGSTGKPKGVMIRHCSVIRLIKNTNYIKIDQDDKITHALSLAFDPFALTVWGALTNGAHLQIIPSQILANPKEVYLLIKKYSPTVTVLTPKLLDLYIAQTPNIFKHIESLYVGGEILSPKVIYAIKQLKKHPRKIINCYGPSENTVITTTYSVSSIYPENASIPIGKPIANTTTYILDKYLNPLPIGAIGELYTGGDGVMIGYLNKQDLTERCLINNRFEASNKHSKIYKTGDLCKWLPDGNIEYHNRFDNQVKIRGFRVEPNEIKQALLRHPNVKAAEIVVEQNNHANELHAYIISNYNTTENNTGKYYRAFLQHYLPNYMLPTKYYSVCNIPLNTSGKVDRKAIKLLDKQELLITPLLDYTDLSNHEKTIINIWENLLNCNITNIDDDFFELGGHSLLTSEMLMRVFNCYKTNIPVHQFLANPSIKHLAHLIEKSKTLLANTLDDQIACDSQLDPIIEPANSLPVEVRPPKSILLTGVTGFLGRYLLRALLRHTDATIYCLIRTKKGDNEKSRLKKLLKDILSAEQRLQAQKRIIPIEGDLEQACLGLSKSIYQTLVQEIDCIYHNGAKVHHIFNYERLRACNVFGTMEIIKFASCAKLKSIYYISTLSLTLQQGRKYESMEEFVDSDITRYNLENGYAQTKWVSEVLLKQAHNRGLPVYIFRPDWISGDKETGLWDMNNNHFLNLVKSCLQLQRAPNWNSKLHFVPVDFLSEAIVKISLLPKKTGHVFNLTNPYPVSWKKFVSILTKQGYPLQLMGVSRWHNEHLKNLSKDNALYPLLPLYLDKKNSHRIQGLGYNEHVKQTNTLSHLHAVDLEYPKIDQALVKNYINSLIASNFFTEDMRKTTGSKHIKLHVENA